MADAHGIPSLIEAINGAVDKLEAIEAMAAEMSQTLDEVTTLHMMIFAASTSTGNYRDNMHSSLGTIKTGIEDIYRGVISYRNQANEYMENL